MKTVLCTLFNSLYLDKGLVLHDSLKECGSDFILYVLCMDEKCYHVLSDFNTDSLIPIKLEEFEDEELLKVKSSRSFGEYCWTCTPSLILYVIEKYKEPICTYVDADMYFYYDPEILIDEMLNAGKSVMIIPHRFSPMNTHSLINGIYCVEFNTFAKKHDSLCVLMKWKKDCLECCTANNDGINFGDQKYLDTWPEEYPETVHVCNNPGAGVALWNIEWYKGCNKEEKTIYYKNEAFPRPIIFYHFQHITYISSSLVRTGIISGIKTIDYQLVDFLYKDYLNKINQKNEMLKTKFEISCFLKKHPAEVLKSDNGWKARLKQVGFVKKMLRYMYPSRYNEEYVVCLERV